MKETHPEAPPAPRGNSISRPPTWLILATGALALTCLVLAIAETNLWAHYLIDRGEFLSLFGLGFIGISGVYLFRRERLFVSLPLAIPWLLYPIITQGDQLIDNLSINAMRIICQVLLAGIFATPVVVIVMAVRYAIAVRPSGGAVALTGLAWIPGIRALSQGRTRKGAGYLAAVLLTLEIGVALQFLGALMMVTLVLMILAALGYARSAPQPNQASRSQLNARKERYALFLLLAGMALSGGVYIGFHHRAGAYQGSPSAFMDPAQKHAFYPLDRIPVPARPSAPPADARAVEQALTSYAHTLELLLRGYHILDRNFTYDFHNHLFLKHTPLLPNYRSAGLQLIQQARLLQKDADAKASVARATLPEGDPLAALLDDVRGYVAFNFDRAPILERMSAEFERTPAGLQHAAHLYEGESKALGTYLEAILRKHNTVLSSPVTATVATDFASISRSIYQAYAHHIVGF